MRRILGIVLLSIAAVVAVRAAQTGPQIQLIDGKLSIQAEAVGLGRLLGLIDRATGMTSKVPAELASRTLSVRFSGLDLDDAVKKVFEGQSIDYVVIDGQGIIVTAISQARRDQPASPFPVAPSFQPPEQPFMEEQQQPFMPQQPSQIPGMPQPGVGMPGQQFPPGVGGNGAFNGQQQPAMIQTPFGPIPNPRANQQGVPNPSGQPIQQQSPLGGQQPFGSLGTVGGPAQNQTLFGNTSPPILNTGPSTMPQQQRRP